MNRDELLSRGTAMPPRVDLISGTSTVHPVDVAGGSWISANEYGTTWALLNWNIKTESRKERSRGEVVLSVAGAKRPSEVLKHISLAKLNGIDPFRLIGISSEAQEVTEWRWNGSELSPRTHLWEHNHWFSSGRSDELAAENRGKAFIKGCSLPDAGSLRWLRQMHRSHEPERGAFSICVHREDAATVSYTEIEVTEGNVRMLYRPGGPCSIAEPTEIKLPRRTSIHF